jgi:DNA polymerase
MANNTETSFKNFQPFLPKDALVMKRKTRAKPCASLEEQAAALAGCTRCKLSKTRTHLVFGEGNPKARLVLVGEGPGESEDLSGRPFVGRAGQLLEKMLDAISLSREDVFICNVVKCRPPENRNPEPDEIESCEPFLFQQLDAIQPKVVMALGKFAAQTLLRTEEPISKIRGKFVEFRGAKLIPSFHPAYLLRNPPAKKESWEDLLLVAKTLGLKPKKKI